MTVVNFDQTRSHEEDREESDVSAPGIRVILADSPSYLSRWDEEDLRD